MGRYAKPDPLEQARQGDEDALEQVLRGVLAPIFDLSLHLFRQPVHAELCTVAALRALVHDIRAGGPEVTPLGAAAAHLLENPAPATPAVVGPEPVDGALASLEEPARRAILAVLACDLDGDELVTSLGPDAPEDYHRGMALVGFPAEAIRGRLDEVAAATALPFGIVDRALA